MTETSSQLVESLRNTLRGSTGQKGDVRFQGGTEITSNFVPWSSDAYNYKPLPAVFQEGAPQSLGRHLASHGGIFPRLNSSVEEVKGKLAPVHSELTGLLKRLDVSGSGHVNMEALETALKETGVFLSKADVHALLPLAPRNIAGELDYNTLLDEIINKAHHETSGHANVPTQFQWQGDEPLIVSLALHTTTQPFAIPAANMKRYAFELTTMRKQEQNPEKIHNTIRHFILQDLLISPGREGQPDLAFRQWLQYNGVIARSDMHAPGVVPPEVYEVFNQIITALGVPSVDSATMVETKLGSSLVHTARRG